MFCCTNFAHEKRLRLIAALAEQSFNQQLGVVGAGGGAGAGVDSSSANSLGVAALGAGALGVGGAPGEGLGLLRGLQGRAGLAVGA